MRTLRTKIRPLPRPRPSPKNPGYPTLPYEYLLSAATLLSSHIYVIHQAHNARDRLINPPTVLSLLRRVGCQATSSTPSSHPICMRTLNDTLGGGYPADVVGTVRTF